MNNHGSIGLLLGKTSNERGALLERPWPIALPRPGPLGKNHQRPFRFRHNANALAERFPIAPLAKDAESTDSTEKESKRTSLLENVVRSEEVTVGSRVKGQLRHRSEVGRGSVVGYEQNPGLLAKGSAQVLNAPKIDAMDAHSARETPKHGTKSAAPQRSAKWFNKAIRFCEISLLHGERSPRAHEFLINRSMVSIGPAASFSWVIGRLATAR
jgi:hypothetical protein